MEFRYCHYFLGQCFILCDEMEGPYSLTIQPEVFSKRVCADQVHSCFEKASDRLDVVVKITRCESKLSCVEEREEAPSSFEQFQNLVPLGFVWVYPSWIVSTRLEQHCCVVGEAFNVVQHVCEVEFYVLCVILAISVDVVVHVIKHLRMVRPSRVAHSNRGYFHFFFQDFTCKFESTTSRECLERAYTRILTF